MITNSNKLHIIYLIPFSPKYEFTDEKKQIELSSHSWRNEKGEFIGVWFEDGAVQRGLYLLKHLPNLTWEVWRPDVRAEKVYHHDFGNGLICKSFPIDQVKYWDGLRFSTGVYSKLMEITLDEYLNKNSNRTTILILPVAKRPFSALLMKKYQNKLPILNVRTVNNENLVGKIKFHSNPLKYVNGLLKAISVRKYMNNVDYLICAHSKFVSEISSRYSCKVWVIPHFEDTNSWKPNIAQEVAKQILNIPQQKTVFFSSSRLVKDYQLHFVVECFASLKDKNFIFYISGHGDEKYIEYLKEHIESFGLGSKIVFLGYLTGDKLKNYYLASDAFVSTCTKNACPKSVNKALLLQIPIIITNSGFGAEILEETKNGILLNPIFNIDEWTSAFKKIIEGEIPSAPAYEFLSEIFDGVAIAQKWLNVFEEIISDTRKAR